MERRVSSVHVFWINDKNVIQRREDILRTIIGSLRLTLVYCLRGTVLTFNNYICLFQFYKGILYVQGEEDTDQKPLYSFQI